MKNIYIYLMLCLFGLGIPGVQGMPLYVKITAATTITLEVEPSDTVDNVKQKIQDQQGILQSQQMLFFAGVKLEDASTLTDNNIQSGDTIDLIPIHTIISVVSGTGFNIKTGTVLGAEGLDLTPSADFSLTSSLSGSAAVSKSTTFGHINKSFQFNETTAGYSGLLKFNYLDTELNSLLASGLKLLYHDGSAWAIDDSSSAADKYLEVTLTSKTLKELSLGNCIIPDAPTANAQSFCVSATVTNLVATGTAVKWYATETEGTALTSDTALVTGTTYYASQTLNTCESARTAVAVTINTTTAPTASDQTFCVSATVANLVATGTAIQWYATATEGTALTNETALVTGTTYYASQTLNTCESTRTAVVVTINTTTAPTASDQTFCVSGTVANLVATGTAIQWYDEATEGTALTSDTSLVNGTTYYASQTLNTCESTRTAVAVTINTTTPPTAAAQTFCVSGTVANLVATGTAIQWYATATEGTALTNETALVTGTTYYASQTVASCESSRKAVVVTVTPKPEKPIVACYETATWNGLTCQYDVTGTKPEAPTTLTCYQTATWNELTCIYDITTNQLNAPIASGTTVCKGNSATLTASGFGTMKWYSASTGGSLLYTGTTFNTPVLNSTTSYYVSATACTRTTSRTQVRVTVSPLAVATSISGAGTLCYGSTKVLTLARGYVGTLKWQISSDGINYTEVSPAATSSSYTTPATLAAGTSYYYRVLLTSGACSTTSAAVQINTAPAVVTGTIAASSTVCSGNATTLVLSGNVGTIQWQYSTSPTGNYSNISGATGASYTTPLLTSSIFYRVMVTNNGCSFATAGYGISVQKASAGSITGVPTSSVCLSTPPTLTLSGFRGTVFQWQSATRSTGTYTAIDGATANNYIANNTTVAGTRYYRVLVSYPGCSTVITPTVAVTFKICAPIAKMAQQIPVVEKFSAIAYPNPFAANFKLGVTTSNLERVNVSVYDLTGRLLEVRNTDVSEIADQEIGTNYPSGVYTIIVTQETEMKTLRVIKR